MKSLGFVFALVTALVITAAQSQSNAGAQTNAASWAGAAAANGARVISVPPGAVTYYQPRQGNRPHQAKVIQANAQSAAAAQTGRVANQDPNAGHAVNAQAVSQGKAKPHHPGHNAPHNAVKHHPKLQANAPQTAVATAAGQAVAVAKAPQQSPSNKGSENSTEPFKLPDLSALGLPKLLGDLPEDFTKVIKSVLTNSNFFKTGSDLVAAFIKTQATTVPAIIEGVNKGLKDAANVISPENVKKAVATLTNKSQEAHQAIAEKMTEIAVSQVDRIGGLVKNLVKVGHFAEAIAIGLSCVVTLGLVFQNEVLPKLPKDLSQLPIPLDKLDKLPIPLDKLHLPFNKTDKLPFPINKILEHFGKKTTSGSETQAQGDQGNAKADSAAKADSTGKAEPTAKAESTGEAVAVASGGATAEAQSTAAAGSPEYSGEEYEEE